MFACTQMMGLDTAYPDVCLTPAPPAPAPVPIPYPNIAAGPMGVPPVVNILFCVAPAHNMGTTIPQTNGDNAGINMGPASGTVMGPARHTTGATTFLISGLPCTRMGSTAMQNSTNTMGLRACPSQIRIIVLCG